MKSKLTPSGKALLERAEKRPDGSTLVRHQGERKAGERLDRDGLGRLFRTGEPGTRFLINDAGRALVAAVPVQDQPVKARATAQEALAALTPYLHHPVTADELMAMCSVESMAVLKRYRGFEILSVKEFGCTLREIRRATGAIIVEPEGAIRAKNRTWRLA